MVHTSVAVRVRPDPCRSTKCAVPFRGLVRAPIPNLPLSISDLWTVITQLLPLHVMLYLKDILEPLSMSSCHG